MAVAGGADKNIHHGDTETRRKQASPVGLWSAAAGSPTGASRGGVEVGVNGLLLLASLPAADRPEAEPAARDRAPAVGARAPSEAVPVDSADPALAPPVAAVPPASDLEEAEAVAVAGGADKRTSCELLAPGF